MLKDKYVLNYFAEVGMELSMCWDGVKHVLGCFAEQRCLSPDSTGLRTEAKIFRHGGLKSVS